MMEREPRVIRCWQCGNEMSVVRAQIGANVECPHCRSAVTVPSQLFGAPAARTIGTASSARAHKSPATAAVLNFLFWGAGYIYAGRSWGWAILIPNILLTFVVLRTVNQESQGVPFSLILMGLVINFLFGWHAYQMVKEQQLR
jgi:DNA-directed RNA polymerase subunit RPC12/RpoP